MNYLLVLEIISVIFNIVFLVLFTKELRWCWIFGIVGSLLGALLFYYQKYYSESILYLFYAAIGVYAWMYWSKKNNDSFSVRSMRLADGVLITISCLLLAFGLGFVMSKTDADKPYLDAISTVFGIMATFLEIYKYVAAWLFWIAINAFTIWLYGIKELNFFALQMIIYTGLSIRGYLLWNRRLNV
jgi:nicotinamide mononucleotide transporter